MHGLQMILKVALVTENALTDVTLGLPAMQRSVISERRWGEKLLAAYLTPLAGVPRFV